MKSDWKKDEKQYYSPKNKPELVQIPAFNFFTIQGTGNPNEAFFAEYIGVLYSLSYAVKMSPKKGLEPPGYHEYSVYPLEGVWDLTEEARSTYNGTFSKGDLVFTLMMRQPAFVDAAYAQEVIERTKKAKPHELLGRVKFEILTEGDCIQMLHNGPYDDEPASFAAMEQFAEQNGWRRNEKTHREIYLSDARKVVPEKLRTVLRFGVDFL